MTLALQNGKPTLLEPVMALELVSHLIIPVES